MKNLILVISLQCLFLSIANGDELDLRKGNVNGQECQYLDAGAYQYVDNIWSAITGGDRTCLVTETGKDAYPQRESRDSVGGQNLRENLTDFRAQTDSNINWAKDKNKKCKDDHNTYSYLKGILQAHQSQPNLCPGEGERIGQYTQEMDGNLKTLQEKIDKREQYISENERLGSAADSNLEQINGIESAGGASNSSGSLIGANNQPRLPASVMSDLRIQEYVDRQMIYWHMDNPPPSIDLQLTDQPTTVQEFYTPQ